MMADLHKFHRSRDRMTELLNYLLSNSTADEKNNTFINDLKKAIDIIDDKIEKFNTKELVNN